MASAPNLGLATALLADVAAQRGAPSKALAAYRKAVKQLYATRQWFRVEALARRGLALQAADRTLGQYQVQALARLGECAQVITKGQDLVSRYPGWQSPLREMAACFAALGQDKKALGAYRQLYQQEKDGAKKKLWQAEIQRFSH